VLIYELADVYPPVPTGAARLRWHAVAIVAAADSCAASKACKDRRFLSGEAPRLPLPGCDAACCDCKYRHFVDRRRMPRRADERGAAAPKHADSERRERRGRRTSDQSAD
jgi:hypothetical protein